VATVHAITIPTPGGPDVLTWAEVPEPVPGTGEVLVEVVAAGVNRADLLQRQGHYPPPPGAPPYPGMECSGRIAALGAAVAGWQVGDEVCALLAGGGYAEEVAVPAGQLLPVPAGVSLVEAAALPEAACTVWSNLGMVAGLRPGDTVLVHGGSGGIGTMAIQVAVARGAEVYCTAGSEAKRERCRQLGASLAIDYQSDDFVARVRERTDGRGVDIVLDIMGGSYLSRNVDALATGGRLVVIGTQGGRHADLNLGTLLAKRASIHATTLRSRPLEEKAAIVAAMQANVWPMIESGVVLPVVDRVLPIQQAAEAHRVIESGNHIGKVLLQVRRS
jgi:putative PIG3 family NAD(P)H quinone oxidoreductase